MSFDKKPPLKGSSFYFSVNNMSLLESYIKNNLTLQPKIDLSNQTDITFLIMKRKQVMGAEMAWVPYMYLHQFLLPLEQFSHTFNVISAL